MGILDKAKSFMGGHGVTVRHTTIEEQAAAAVSLPITTGGVKGTFTVTTEKPCTVLSMKSEFCVEIQHSDGRVEELVWGRDVFPEPYTTRTNDMVKYPFELAAEQVVEDVFNIVLDGDIQTLLANRTLAIGREVRFFIRTMIDIKGSPFDPETVDELTITP